MNGLNKATGAAATLVNKASDGATNVYAKNYHGKFVEKTGNVVSSVKSKVKRNNAGGESQENATNQEFGNFGGFR